eukprot:6685218-Prorocentrum_lima.AAC.1
MVAWMPLLTLASSTSSTPTPWSRACAHFAAVGRGYTNIATCMGQRPPSSTCGWLGSAQPATSR